MCIDTFSRKALFVIVKIDVSVCDVRCWAGRLHHRVFITGIEGGDYWLDRKVLEKVFSGFGLVLDVFIPKGKKVFRPQRIRARSRPELC